MKKLLFVFGTRPEAIKMAPVVKAFAGNQNFISKVCVTAQHREMLDQVLEFFSIKPDYDLNIMKANQNLFQITASVITDIKAVYDDFMPDYVFVHGDTTTSMAASLAAFYAGAKVCHVEAGLRTYNKHAPFPEEINRRLTGQLADIHFAPTETSKKNLLQENISEENIYVTGNTVIDALMMGLETLKSSNFPSIKALEDILDVSKPIVLVTGHRRENHGEGFDNICDALLEISHKADVQVVYPVHRNPNVMGPVYQKLQGYDNIKLVDPLPYEAFIWLINKSAIIITDSGGIQEEAPSLGKPVLVMRDTTERPEAVTAGTVILVGTDKNKIVSEALSLINDENRYKEMSRLHNPYGDGKASERILKAISEL